jgi:hypothetical protein
MHSFLKTLGTFSLLNVLSDILTAQAEAEEY